MENVLVLFHGTVPPLTTGIEIAFSASRPLEHFQRRAKGWRKFCRCAYQSKRNDELLLMISFDMSKDALLD